MKIHRKHFIYTYMFFLGFIYIIDGILLILTLGRNTISLSNEFAIQAMRLEMKLVKKGYIHTY